MSIVLQSSGGGSVTLQEAVTASNLTITVPAVTGTMLTTASAGTVLQVVNATFSTIVSSTSSSWVTTGLTASITPSSSSSKIFVVASIPAQNLNNSNGALFTLFRGTTSGTNLGNSTEGFGNFAISLSGQLIAPYSLNYVDSPATTSSTTYTIAMWARAGTTVIAQNGGAVSSITLLEIAA
jgi:hypothetical protein